MKIIKNLINRLAPANLIFKSHYGKEPFSDDFNDTYEFLFY
jgi:hypothetical protein